MRRLAVVFCLLAVALYLSGLDTVASRAADFYHLWVGGHLVASGQGALLYDVNTHRTLLTAMAMEQLIWFPRNEVAGAFFYPPPAGLLYAPLGALDVYSAGVVQGLATLAAAAAASLAAARLWARQGVSAAWIFAAMLAAPTVFYCYGLGQNGVMTALVVTGCLLAVQRQRLGLAGVLFGVLCAKPSWLLALCWLPLVLRSRRFVVGAIASVAMLMLVSLLVVGAESFAAYVRLSEILVALPELPGYPLMKQHSLMALSRTVLGNGTGAVLGVVACITVAGMTAWRLRTAGDEAATRLGLIGAAATLVNPHVHHYDMVLVVFAAVAALAALPRLTRGRRVVTVLVVAGWYASFATVGLLQVSLPTVLTVALWMLLLRWAPGEDEDGHGALGAAADTAAAGQPQTTVSHPERAPAAIASGRLESPLQGTLLSRQALPRARRAAHWEPRAP